MQQRRMGHFYYVADENLPYSPEIRKIKSENGFLNSRQRCKIVKKCFNFDFNKIILVSQCLNTVKPTITWRNSLRTFLLWFYLLLKQVVFCPKNFF